MFDIPDRSGSHSGVRWRRETLHEPSSQGSESIPRDDQPLVSVVTPVYNGAEYLAECIESVLGQSYENWEHVIVDNCSTDGTLEIARGFEARDRRIRVESPGVFVDLVESGNRTLREISPESKYTKVLHADDWLFPECLERMVELAERNPTVGVVSAYRLEETGAVTLTGLSPSISVLSGREICRSTLLGEPYPHLFGSPTSLLIRSDLVRARDAFYDPDYDVGDEYPFTEDLAVCCEILRESDFGFVHQVLTFTRRDGRSPFSKFSRLGANVPEHLNLLSRYGPVYLKNVEYQRIVAVYLVRYAFLLARSLPKLAKSEFRAYHGAATSRILRSVDASDAFEGVRLQLRRMRNRRRLGARSA
jgi:glycosyltransferase involved in cell wall biosynthesis